MIYTTIDEKGHKQTFEGFRPYHPGMVITVQDEVVIVNDEGDFDVWVVRNDLGREELERYYRAEHGGVDFKIMSFTSCSVYRNFHK